MIIIGEKINGMFKSIGKAIDERDKKVLQQTALEQAEAGAHYLDISTGPGVDNAPEVMSWMVQSVQEVTELPLSIDTPDIVTMEAGVKTAAKGKNRIMINSVTVEKKKMEALFPLAKEYNAEIICVLLTEKGIPHEPTEKCELAMQVLTTAMEYGLSTDALYLDPVLLPVSAAQDYQPKVLETLAMFKTLCDPRPKTVVGLSNVSNQTKERPLINRTYLVMLMAYGLDAAILNPLDRDLMAAIKTGEILLNKKLYCDSYLMA